MTPEDVFTFLQFFNRFSKEEAVAVALEVMEPGHL